MKIRKNLWKISVPILLVSGLVVVAGCNSKPQPAIPAAQKRELANVLYNQRLYAQAVDEYREYLDDYPLEPQERANISYQVANIYFNRLHDYENALAYFLRIKYLYPESNLQAEVGKKIVACLERLKRSTDAQQVIEQTAALDEAQKPVSKPGEVIATIGERKITTGDLQYEISTLPVYVQEQIKTREQKLEFLKNYIAQELLYDSAKRQGLDKDREVRQAVAKAERSLMAQKILQQEIKKEVSLDKYSNADVELYFKANREKYAEKDDKGKVKRQREFSEVQEQVAQDFIQEKQQQAYQALIDRLMKAEQVTIYESKFQ